MIKKKGKFKEVSWDEALDYTASKLKKIIKKGGPDSVAGLSSARCTNEENYLFQKFIRAVLGTNNVDHCARL
jgi:predicted molibdopterin-dependent oxidoreductase YjgC